MTRIGCAVLGCVLLGTIGCGGGRTLTLDLGGGEKMTLIRMPAGEFQMGSPDSEVGRDPDESPVHTVRITRAYYIGETEVTQPQWRAVMGDNPSWHPGEGMPVTRVSWPNCEEFCKKASEITGRTVRLPTEAEWEYACRAGTTTAYFFGDDVSELTQYAWCNTNSPRKAADVKQKLPNRWGLYDIAGNVWEWCADTYHPSYVGAPADGSAWTTKANASDPRDLHVLRGGAWFGFDDQCRSARRQRHGGSMRSAYIGLRVVVEIPE